MATYFVTEASTAGVDAIAITDAPHVPCVLASYAERGFGVLRNDAAARGQGSRWRTRTVNGWKCGSKTERLSLGRHYVRR